MELAPAPAEALELTPASAEAVELTPASAEAVDLAAASAEAVGVYLLAMWRNALSLCTRAGSSYWFRIQYSATRSGLAPQLNACLAGEQGDRVPRLLRYSGIRYCGQRYCGKGIVDNSTNKGNKGIVVQPQRDCKFNLLWLRTSFIY